MNKLFVVFTIKLQTTNFVKQEYFKFIAPIIMCKYKKTTKPEADFFSNALNSKRLNKCHSFYFLLVIYKRTSASRQYDMILIISYNY